MGVRIRRTARPYRCPGPARPVLPFRMPFLRIVHDGHVCVIHMARGKANALTADMVSELAEAVEAAAVDGRVRAVVLASDAPRLFCGGFDVSEVFAYERDRMRTFFAQFAGLFERLRTLPKPVVGALSGHAYAGGAILALACDIRVMADTASLAVNEVDLGVVLPTRMMRAMAANAGTEIMRALMMGGEAVSAGRALAAGLVSEVAPAIDVLPVSITRARLLGDKPARAFAAHKRALDTVGPAMPDEAELDEMMDVWFGEEATARRQALIEKLARK